MSLLLAQSIKTIYPDSEFAIENDDLDTIRWFKNQPEIFDKQAVLSNVELIKIENQQKTYQPLRRKEYPSIGDQLDALWKGGVAAEEMAAKIQAVKDKYPKP
jgi:hypothetical protein